MTAEIITFPVAKRSPEGPLRYAEIIRDTILTAVNMKALGLGPENLSANMDHEDRQMMELVIDLVSERDTDGDTPA